MSLAAKLSKLVSFETPAIPSLMTLASRKERILDRWPEIVTSPPEKDRERLVQEVRRRLAADRWNGTPMSLVTTAGLALFDVERRARPDLAVLREFYCQETRASTRRSFLDAMLSVYIGSYQPGAPHTKDLASALSASSDRIGPRGQILLRSLPEVLDPLRAPAAVATLMTRMDDCWNGLKAIGMRTPHASGLMDHAHLAFVEKVRPALGKRAELERLFRWLKPRGQSAKMYGAGAAITAVLEPWLKVDPPQDELRFITETLISLYGDPRVDDGGPWTSVPSDHLTLFMRWLTGENIRFFLDVVSAVETTHMWAPRRKFWLSLHDQRRIDAAWVAFSPSGASHARRQLASRGDKNLMRFGHQTAGGNRIDTSLLILKIGNKIVVEGSHSYKVYIFKATHPQSPQLYNSRYDCEVIRGIPGAEAKAHNGHWQSWVLERI